MARNPATTSFAGVAYRYANYDTPFWARSNTGPGRWHVPGDGPTQYLSLTTDGAWAELIRDENLSTEAEVALVRMDLWQVRIDCGRLADYRDFEKAEAAGFAPAALIDDDYARCQREGRRLRDLGYGGVIAPSAALPGEANLTLFGARVAVAWDSNPTLTSAVPAGVMTRGAPPEGLAGRVRFVGARHTGYAAYRRAKRKS